MLAGKVRPPEIWEGWVRTKFRRKMRRKGKRTLIKKIKGEKLRSVSHGRAKKRSQGR